jgi:alpha-tubulin suppressor-like RCC1 family protein
MKSVNGTQLAFRALVWFAFVAAPFCAFEAEGNAAGLNLLVTQDVGASPLQLNSAKALTGPDADGDGLPDADEIAFGSNPFVRDTDGDRASDLVEFEGGTNPRDPESFPIFTVNRVKRQFLDGDTLVLRGRSLGITTTRATNYTYTTNVTDDMGASQEVTTNLLVSITNRPAFQWFRNGTLIQGATNLELAILRVRTSESGLYQLRARQELSSQTNVDLRVPPPEPDPNDTNTPPIFVFPSTQYFGPTLEVEVLGFRATRAARHPQGIVTLWGSNNLGQLRAPGSIIDAARVSGGVGHSAVLSGSGTVAVWGDNSSGQTQLPTGVDDVSELSAGSFHTLALRSDGSVVAWGGNQFGQTVVPPRLTNVIAVAAGGFHSMALQSNGTVVCWGRNIEGQSDVPAGLSQVVAISAGAVHSVALLRDGSVRAWGGDAAGQSTVPNLGGAIGAISAGASHTIAVRRNGSLIGWGTPEAYESADPRSSAVVEVAAGSGFSFLRLANGSVVSIGGPTIPTGLSNAVAVAAGFAHGLAISGLLDTDEDTLDDQFERSISSLTNVVDSDGDRLHDGIELRLGFNPTNRFTFNDGIDDFRRVSLGLAAAPLPAPEGSVAVEPAQQLEFFALGGPGYQLQASDDGQSWTNLGPAFSTIRGRTTQFFANSNRWDFFRVIPPQGLPSAETPPSPFVSGSYGNALAWGTFETIPLRAAGIVQAAVGPYLNAGIRADGSVVEWGANCPDGCEGPTNAVGVTAVAVGDSHVLALRSDRTVVAWGNNIYGQTVVPEGLGPVTAIAAAGGHSMALLEDGTVAGWGADDVGQSDVPAGLSNVVAIAAGFSHSVALRADGTVVSWGDNRFSQSVVPTNLPPVASIAAGFGHTLARLRDGTVRAWGNNANGETDVPAGLDGVAAVAAGWSHSVARRENGEVVVWGSDEQGQKEIPTVATNATFLTAGGSLVLALLPPLDADSDGLDDRYESVVGTNPGSADSDGDGLPDAFEILNGFDPLASTEAADGATTIRPAVRLLFFTLQDTSYSLETSANLRTWQFGGTSISGTAGFSGVFRVAEEPAQFFRLRWSRTPSN